MSDLEVTFAGAVSLRRGPRRVGDRAFGSRQLQLVTALLVVERATPVTLDELASQLWSGRPPARWKPAVRGLVSQFRRRLVDLGLDPDAVVGDQGCYRVSLGDVRVDLEAAFADVGAARSAIDEGEVDRGVCRAGAARSVLSRPVLPGVESGWLDRLRDRAARAHLESLVLLGTGRRRLGAHAHARSVLAEAVGLDPLREDAWRALMRAEAAAGNVARALAAYEDLRARLADELGVDPATETQRLHAELLRGVPDSTSGVAVVHRRSPDAGSRSHVAPYVGLRTFTREDADVFFGRDAEVQVLVERLVRHGIVAVVGPSGVGKSSLVRAGLLPALARGAVPDSDTWSTVVMTPGPDPLGALARALAAIDPGLARCEAAASFAHAEDGLHRTAEQVLADAAPTARLLLVVDQFEELFTLATLADAVEFVDLLAAAVSRLDRRVVAVVTFRADHYHRAAEVAGLADLLSHSQFVVPQLAGEQVEIAVTGPADCAGVTLEPGLLGHIVADVAGEPGSLPLLQHLLYELWEHRDDRVLTCGAYREVGGVAGALSHRAETVWDGLDEQQRALARRILLRAVRPGTDGRDTRRPVAESELGGQPDAATVTTVVEQLVDGRLLTADRRSGGTERTWELAHEALIDAWPRLRAWVDQARGHLEDHRRLARAAREWSRHDRRDDWLLGGIPLEEAHGLQLAARRGQVDLRLSPDEADLVSASLAARDLVQRWEAQRQEDRRHLERRTRRLQAAVIVVAVVLLLTALVVWAG